MPILSRYNKRISNSETNSEPKKVGQKSTYDTSETGESNNLFKSRINECRSAFSGLEKHLHNYNMDSSKIDNLSEDVLKAEKKFTTLKKMLENYNYTIHMLDHGEYIENNLNGLRRTVSYYKISESIPSKIGIVISSFLVGGLLGSSCATSGMMGYDTGPEAIIGSFLGAGLVTGAIATAIMLVIEKNPVTYFIQRSHHSTIENIAKYSDLFFDDLREKMK